MLIIKLGSRLDLPVAYALMAALGCLLPLLIILCKRQDYLELRTRAVVFWLMCAW